LGSAVVVGTSWSYSSYTFVNSDEGDVYFSAVAILFSKSASSAAVRSLVLGPSLAERWKSTSGVGEAGGRVDTWTGMLNGIVLSNTGGAARPNYTAVDATLNNKPSIAGDGSAMYLRTTAYAPDRPGTTPNMVAMVVKQNSWTSGRRLYGSGASNNVFVCLTQTSSPNVGIFNTTGTPDNGGLTVGSWKRFGAYYSNSVSDYTLCGATLLSGTSAGNSLPSGNLTLFASGLIGLFSDITLAEFFILRRNFTAAEQAAFDDYCSSEYVAGMV
jgi:hypothetical protein